MMTASADAKTTNATSNHSVDVILSKAWAGADVEPAVRSSDDEFLRRVTLDLIGRIPTIKELATFRNSPDRSAKIDKLLDATEFDRFQAELWTSVLVGYGDQFEANREVLRRWLEERFRRRTAYNRIARTLITAEGESAFSGPVNFLLRHPETPVVKVSRVFLGVRLDCARCHDHPFDRWTQKDFERMNRFFAATDRQEVSEGNIRLVNLVAEAEDEERPRFLTGATPRTSRWRDEFALFTTRSRPFARAFANRLWYQLFGRGNVHPVDDFNRDNAAAVPELTEHLADHARKSGYDIRSMLRLICTSRAYQLTSRSAEQDAKRIRVFAARTIRPLSPEQMADSVGVAMGQKMSAAQRREFIEESTRGTLDEDSGETWAYRETVQEVMLGLAMRLPSSADSIDNLFERVLTRLPTDQERRLCANRQQADILFALIHSNEFRFNH